MVLFGCGYIVFSKLHGFGAFYVTSIPVVVMIGYALLLAFARLLRLRDDQSGDNLYYMGFLFTLTSLAVSLYQFSATGSAEQIVQNFGVAIASTISGIALRIFFNQMRQDPIEVEHATRLELAEASRRVKRELESTVLEFSYFRRATQQSISDALDEVNDMLAQAKDRLCRTARRFCGNLQQAARAGLEAVRRNHRGCHRADVADARSRRGAHRRGRPGSFPAVLPRSCSRSTAWWPGSPRCKCRTKSSRPGWLP